MDVAPIRDEADAIAHVLARTGRVNGDDAAVLRVGGGAVCVSTDSAIEGVHVPRSSSPRALGRRAAARALSDLAAMGAVPAGITCAVHVPDGRWQDAVEAVGGLADRAGEQGAELVGGDFTSTPSAALALVVTVLGRRAGGRRDGFVERAGMRAGDELFVTGSLGAARHALDANADELPEPPDRLGAGVALARHARAMIDCSDGLARDAAQLAARSDCALELDLDALPLAHPDADRLRVARAGDDYELLVAIAPDRVAAARADLARACPQLALTRIGRAAAGAGVTARVAGAVVELGGGFVHA